MWHGLRLGVVVPAFNEQRLLGSTLQGLPEFVDHVCVVDDASRDGTERVARSGGRRVTCIRHAENRGVGAAIVTGYRNCLSAKCDVLVVMAGDNQMDPADLPALLRPIVEDGADYVKGNRLAHPERARMPVGRRIAGAALAWLTSRATGYAVHDSQCGYTALRADAAARLPLDELWPRYGYPNDLLGLMAARGLKLAEVPVRPIYATESSGIRPYHAAVVAGLILRRRFLTQGTPAFDSTGGRPLDPESYGAASARSTIVSAKRKAWVRSKQRDSASAERRSETSGSAPNSS